MVVRVDAQLARIGGHSSRRAQRLNLKLEATRPQHPAAHPSTHPEARPNREAAVRSNPHAAFIKRRVHAYGRKNTVALTEGDRHKPGDRHRQETVTDRERRRW